MATLVILLLFAVLCLSLAPGRAWSDETWAGRNALVFAGRNRRYGAFRLRQEYPKHMGVGVLGAFGLLAALAALPRLAGGPGPNAPAAAPPEIVVDVDLSRLVAPPPAPLPPATPPARRLAPPETSRSDVPVLVDADSVATPAPDVPDTSAWASVPPGGGPSGAGADSLAGPGPGAGGGNGASTTWSTADVQELPAFPGGMAAMVDWVRRNLDFPPDLPAKDVVYVQFTVGADGAVQDVNALRGLRESSKKAAERTVRNMPRWVPARMNGQPVRCRLVLPIKFETR